MKDYAHYDSKKAPVEPQLARQNGNTTWNILISAFIMVLVFSCAFWGRLYLNQQFMQFTVEKNKLSNEITEKKHAIVELRNRRESLQSWAYVKSKIDSYHLDLVKLDSNKLRYLTRCSIDEYKNGTGRSEIFSSSAGTDPLADMPEFAMLSESKSYTYR